MAGPRRAPLTWWEFTGHLLVPGPQCSGVGLRGPCPGSLAGKRARSLTLNPGEAGWWLHHKASLARRLAQLGVCVLNSSLFRSLVSRW